MYSEYEPASSEKKLLRGHIPNPRFLGRTDLCISPSKAKFDEEADFDVRSAVDFRKPRQIDEKRKFQSKNFAEKKKLRRKTKRPKSSETRFGKVSRRSEPCSSRYEKFSPRIKFFDLNPQPHL